MERQELEQRYYECVKKIAKNHFEGKDSEDILKEIEKIRTRMLYIDLAKAMEEYKKENNISSTYQI